jgi:hypothetical protein
MGSPRPRSQPNGGRQRPGLVSPSVKAVQAFPVPSLFPQITGSFFGNHTLQDLNLELAGLKMDFERVMCHFGVCAAARKGEILDLGVDGLVFHLFSDRVIFGKHGKVEI